MTATDWWWTGRNNATDNGRYATVGGKVYSHRFGYWPPRGVGFVCGLYYRVGWVCGKVAPNRS